MTEKLILVSCGCLCLKAQLRGVAEPSFPMSIYQVHFPRHSRRLILNWFKNYSCLIMDGKLN